MASSDSNPNRASAPPPAEGAPAPGPREGATREGAVTDGAADPGDLSALAARLRDRVAERYDGGVEIAAVLALSGGACQDNFGVELRFDGGPLDGPRRMVLRSDAPRSLPRSLTRAQEFRVIEAAVEAGVPTPRVRWLLQDVLREGASAYLMDFAPGVAIGAKVLRDEGLAAARARLPGELSEALARIHGITPGSHPQLFDEGPPIDPAARDLEQARKSLAALRAPRPALELALRWLDTHKPEPTERVLAHGDFRTGNFLVTPDGLSAVLDWEFAQWSAPEEDLGWLSVRDWRFGQLDRPIGGFGDRASFYAAYERASGRAVDPVRVHWWEVMGNVRWGTGCVYQAERYLSGEQRDLELLAIGRRVAEMEFEALRLIEVGHAG